MGTYNEPASGALTLDRLSRRRWPDSSHDHGIASRSERHFPFMVGLSCDGRPSP